MADISELLSIIDTDPYGFRVKRALHDAIDEINRENRELKERLHALESFKKIVTTAAEYESLPSRDPFALYFLMDTGELYYRGNKYGHNDD